MEEEFLAAVEAYLRRSGMAPTTFGRRAIGDPQFVWDLRRGRECRRATRERALKFMRDNRPPRRRIAEPALDGAVA